MKDKDAFQEEKDNINQMIDNLKDDLDVALIQKACDALIEKRGIDASFDPQEGWNAFQTMIETKYKPALIRRKKIKKSCLIAAIIAMSIPCTTIFADPIKKHLIGLSEHLSVFSSRIVTTQENITPEGVYVTFDDVPLDIIYPNPTSEEILLKNSIQVDSYGNVFAEYQIPKYQAESVLFHINKANDTFFIEHNTVAYEVEKYDNIEFSTTSNHNWMITVWEYNNDTYSLYYPKENGDAIRSLFIQSLFIG